MDTCRIGLHGRILARGSGEDFEDEAGNTDLHDVESSLAWYEVS